MRLHDAAFYLAAFFILGIGFASLGISVWLALTTSILASTLLYLFKSETIFNNKKVWYAFFIFITFLGFFYYHLYSTANSENITFDRIIDFQGIVVKEPMHGLESQQLGLELLTPYKGEVRVYTAPYPRFEYGNVLQIKGEITKSTSGRLNMVSFPEVEFLESGQGSAVKSFLFGMKNKLVESLQQVLPPQKSALISGILFGQRAEFSGEFKEALNKSGTTHIVALSGYNITIIATTLATVLSYLWNRRKAFWVSIVFIIVFVIMTGVEESVVRAAIMGILALVALRSSRLYNMRNAITLTALIMLLFNPKLLVFNIGFQLSFTALLGIVYLKPVLEKLLKIDTKQGFLNWKENLLQTSSAQAAALPVILGTFGYFSPLSVIANVLILGFIPVTMFFGFITASLGIVSYHLSLIAGWITGMFLGYEIFIINLFTR